MDTLNPRHIAEGDGTPEAEWLDWLCRQALPCMAVEGLVQPAERAVVIAPHPDDEVLAVGGVMAQLAGLGRSLAVVAVTDGEASHPGSPAWPPARLAQQRIRETGAALQALGADPLMMRLGLPDGGVTAHAALLTDLLQHLLMPGDVVFTTWRFDGHPDHEATALATRAAAQAVGARVFEVPVWGWHWAPVGDARMPWSNACMVPLTPDSVRRKNAALQAFATQLEPDASCAAAAVLRPSTVQRAQRPFEVVFA
ncbi:PIG-L deacetylase family protein [Pseudorhodoferax sp. Leaf267]|uniref:PIG-L deacetylase family protein n=1 Tax=Pseudorhodoferax sp. Leaf267 TaxID=1736316 RepID=UPI0006FDEA9C|nr:PIG-L family deacetylase [Pseudorhodoferax sp. Leaf267]KQP23502.1 acetylglucosaminylphosphatidylinositol deacetylase [Pseudorhodoferax sp. Leaf267]